MNPLCLQNYGGEKKADKLIASAREPGYLFITQNYTKKIPDGLRLNMLHEGEMTSAMLLQIVGLFLSHVLSV